MEQNGGGGEMGKVANHLLMGKEEPKPDSSNLHPESGAEHRPGPPVCVSPEIKCVGRRQ